MSIHDLFVHQPQSFTTSYGARMQQLAPLYS